MLLQAEGPFELVACNDTDKTSALTKYLRFECELKCYVECLHPLVGAIPKDEEEEGEKDE